MENVNYDRNVIQAFANTMYAKANKIIFSEMMKYAFIGGAFCFCASFFMFNRMETSTITNLVCFAFGAFVCGIYGYQAGQMKSFHLKLEAQRALCFAQMELNSRTNPTFREAA